MTLFVGLTVDSGYEVDDRGGTRDVVVQCTMYDRTERSAHYVTSERVGGVWLVELAETRSRVVSAEVTVV